MGLLLPQGASVGFQPVPVPEARRRDRSDVGIRFHPLQDESDKAEFSHQGQEGG